MHLLGNLPQENPNALPFSILLMHLSKKVYKGAKRKVLNEIIDTSLVLDVNTKYLLELESKPWLTRKKACSVLSLRKRKGGDATSL